MYFFHFSRITATHLGLKKLNNGYGIFPFNRGMGWKSVSSA